MKDYEKAVKTMVNAVLLIDDVIVVVVDDVDVVVSVGVDVDVDV